jgi:hypothetical protein
LGRDLPQGRIHLHPLSLPGQRRKGDHKAGPLDDGAGSGGIGCRCQSPHSQRPNDFKGKIPGSLRVRVGARDQENRVRIAPNRGCGTQDRFGKRIFGKLSIVVYCTWIKVYRTLGCARFRREVRWVCVEGCTDSLLEAGDSADGYSYLTRRGERLNLYDRPVED